MSYFEGERVSVVGVGEICRAIRTVLTDEGAVVDVEPDDDTFGLVVVCMPDGGGAEAVCGLLAKAESAMSAHTPFMHREGQGSVVIVAPPLGSERLFGLLAAESAYGALRGAVRAWAVAHGPSGVRVNLVRPGIVGPPGGEYGVDYGHIPLHTDRSDRAGAPDDVAHAVAFLLSGDAAYITGAELLVDGALSQCRSSSAFVDWDSRTA